MPNQIDVKAAFLEFLGRSPTPAEAGAWFNRSGYALGRWIRHQPEYVNSREYNERLGQIQLLATQIWGEQL